MKRIGFIGLGLMGGPMAANFARAGYPLTVYNRSPEKCEPLKALGAKVAASPAEVAQASDVVITMLSDAQAVEGVIFGADGVLAGARPGMVLIDMSTIAPEQSRSIAARLLEHGIAMLDAPVIGSTGPAAAGTLGIMVGGDEQVFQANRDVLSVMGKDLYYMGPQGSGAQMKLSMNLMVAAQLASLCEALVMAAKAGLDLQLAGKIISDSGIASNLIIRKVAAINNMDYTPAFPLKHLHKDLGLIIRTGDAVGAPLPVTSVIHQLYIAAKEQGHGEEDSASLFIFLADIAGLKR